MAKIQIKNIESSKEVNNNDSGEYDVMNDVHYICKSCSLITDFLKKGCDVMQLANGDVLVTEVKSVTFHYSWNEKKEKLVRVYGGSGTKSKKSKDLKEDDFEDDLELEIA
jgi:hypothetical protein